MGGHGARRRDRAEGRAEVGLVLLLRRRAARPGPPERDGVPARASRRLPGDPPTAPGRRRARPGRLREAPADGGSRRGARAGEPRASRKSRRQSRSRRRRQWPKPRRRLSRRGSRRSPAASCPVPSSWRAWSDRASMPRTQSAQARSSREAGYQSDERTADERARVLAARLQGDLAIRVDLRRRGISDVDIDSALESIDPELARAEALARRARDAAQLARDAPSQGLQPRTRSRPRCGSRAHRSKMESRLILFCVDELPRIGTSPPRHQ